jgi:hypothetical protein
LSLLIAKSPPANALVNLYKVESFEFKIDTEVLTSLAFTEASMATPFIEYTSCAFKEMVLMQISMGRRIRIIINKVF